MAGSQAALDGARFCTGHTSVTAELGGHGLVTGKVLPAEFRVR